MFLRLMAATLAAYALFSLTEAQAHPRLLSPAEKRAYHACLYASFINNYCRYHAWGDSEAAFRECVIANGAGRVRISFPYWGWGAYRNCRAVIQGGRF